MIIDVAFETTQTFDVEFETSKPFDVDYDVIGGGRVLPTLESLSVTPTEEAQTFTPSAGVDGYSDVSVSAIPDDYVGSAITRDPLLTASGATVTAHAGYYSENQTKTVASGSATTPTKTITADPVIQVDGNGLITATELVNAYVTPIVETGWVTSGVQGKITVSGQRTQQLDTVAGQTIAPTESVQTAVASKRFTTGDVKIGAIPSTYVGTGVTRQAGSTVTPTENAQSVVAADTFVTGAISVDAIPSDYVGSQIERRDSDDLIATGNLVNVPAGFYAENAGKAIAEGSTTTPATTITANPSITVGSDGLITAAVSASASVTPTIQTGYVVMGGGTAGTVTASGSATQQLTTQGAQTITPTTSDQTIAAGTYLTGVQTVKGDPNLTMMNIVADAEIFGVSGYPLNKNTFVTIGQEAGSAAIRNGKKAWVNGNLVTGNMPDLAATTYTPTSSAQTIATGSYIAGTQTIEGVVCSNLSSGNIKNGVVVKIGTASDDDSVTSVTGSYTGGSPNLQAKTNINPTTSSQTVTADNGYDGLSSVQINAMPSGTEGTPTATKGTVTNHSVTVTPSVTNSAGYISGGTHNGTAITVSASELVSGTLSITSSGTKDVTNYASASVASGSATANATKGTVSNHSITVTPSVTKTAGYIAAGTTNGTAVTVSASELVSGSETKTSNGTYDVTNLAELVVNVSGGGGTLSYDTKTATASNYPTSLSFGSMKGQPKFFAVRLNAQVSSSGSTTYYYIVDIVSNCNGTSAVTHGNCFRIGSTRRVDNITSGYSYTYTNSTLTITSSAASRSASPGAFYSGSYELIYAY